MTASRRDKFQQMGFGAVFFAWLYGVPFLFIVALVRSAATPYTPTLQAARAFNAVTDTLLMTAFVLTAALPSLGLVLARAAGKPDWRRNFVGAVAAVFVIYLAVAVVASATTGPLIDHTPPYVESPSPSTHCVPISGGKGCPGG